MSPRRRPPPAPAQGSGRAPAASGGPTWFDQYLEHAFDPFRADLDQFTAEEVPLSWLRDPGLPVGVFVVAYLVRRGIGWNRGDVRHGLRDLLDRHPGIPLGDLTGELVRADEATLRDLGRQDALDRLDRALALPVDPRRDRAIVSARCSVDRNGSWRWHAYTSAVGALHRFALALGVHGLSPQSPAHGLVRRAAYAPARAPLDEAQLTAVWQAAATHRDPELAGLVLDLLRETATRRGSVCQLRLDDIAWADSTVRLHVKFHRIHDAVVSEDLITRIALRAFRQGWDGLPSPVGRDAPPSRPALRRADGSALTARWFDGLFGHVDRRLQQQGIDLGFRVTAHYIRHTTIAQVDRIAGPEVAAQWAGHVPRAVGPNRGEATAIYTRWRPEELKALLAVMFKNQAGPVDPVLLHGKYLWMVEHGQLS